jgi:hypothetical protein
VPACLPACACRYEEGKLSSAKVESDTFGFRLQPYAKPSIQVRQADRRAGQERMQAGG